MYEPEDYYSGRGRYAARASIIHEHWLSRCGRDRCQLNARLEYGMRQFFAAQESEYDPWLPMHVETPDVAHTVLDLFARGSDRREQKQYERQEQQLRRKALNTLDFRRGWRLPRLGFHGRVRVRMESGGLVSGDDLVGLPLDYLTACCQMPTHEAVFVHQQIAKLNFPLEEDEQRGEPLVWSARIHRQKPLFLGDWGGYDFHVSAVLPGEARWQAFQRYRAEYTSLRRQRWPYTRAGDWNRPGVSRQIRVCPLVGDVPVDNDDPAAQDLPPGIDGYEDLL